MDTKPELPKENERPDQRNDDAGGDLVCWLSRVCFNCGRFSEVEQPTTCTNCGAEISDE